MISACPVLLGVQFDYDASDRSVCFLFFTISYEPAYDYCKLMPNGTSARESFADVVILVTYLEDPELNFDSVTQNVRSITFLTEESRWAAACTIKFCSV